MWFPKIGNTIVKISGNEKEGSQWVYIETYYNLAKKKKKWHKGNKILIKKHYTVVAWNEQQR